MVLSNRVNFLLVRLCSLSDHPSISVENHLMAKNNTALATDDRNRKSDRDGE